MISARSSFALGALSCFCFVAVAVVPCFASAQDQAPGAPSTSPIPPVVSAPVGTLPLVPPDPVGAAGLREPTSKSEETVQSAGFPVLPVPLLFQPLK